MNVLISPFSESSILPEDLATQSVKLKEEQLRREEEKVCSQEIVGRVRCVLMCYFQLREIELRVQREINEKRQELLAKEESLRHVVILSSYVFILIFEQELGESSCCTRLAG